MVRSLTPSGGSEVLFSSDRAFTVWRYGVGHSQLMIRSVPAGAEQECLDLRFEAVAALKLAVHYRTIAICLASEDATRELHSFARVEEEWQPKYVALELRTRGESGYVLCRSVRAVVGGVEPAVVSEERQRLLWGFRAGGGD